MTKLTKNPNSSKYYSSRQESYISKLLGGSMVAGSGAPAFCAGDIILDDWLIEAKTSMKPKSSFSIKKEWIEKHYKEAFANRLFNTAIAFNFNFEDEQDYYIIDDKLMKFLVEKLKEEYK